jgi:hypothetical protein
MGMSLCTTMLEKQDYDYDYDYDLFTYGAAMRPRKLPSGLRERAWHSMMGAYVPASPIRSAAAA